MKKALILTWEGYKDYEAVYPYYRLIEEGFKVDVISNTIGKVQGILGSSIPSDYLISDLDDPTIFSNFLNNYEILILPGGVVSLEKLRLCKSSIKFISEWNQLNKIIGSICSGAQMLISAKVVKGRNITGYYSIKDDLINAGANFIDAPAVTDKNIISSPHYKWVGQWMKEVINVYNIK
jgi:protease I